MANGRVEQERGGQGRAVTGQDSRLSTHAWRPNPSNHASESRTLAAGLSIRAGCSIFNNIEFRFSNLFVFLPFSFPFALYFFPSLSIRLHAHTHTQPRTLQLAFTFCYFCRPHSIRPANLQWAAGYLKIAALAKDKLCLFLKPYER